AADPGARTRSVPGRGAGVFSLFHPVTRWQSDYNAARISSYRNFVPEFEEHVMTAILVLLCLTVAGLELYMALGRRRQPPDAGRISGLEAANAELTRRLTDAERRGREQDAVVAALRPAVDELTALPERAETLADGLVRLQEGSGRQEI